MLPSLFQTRTGWMENACGARYAAATHARFSADGDDIRLIPADEVWEPVSEEEFTSLQQQKARKTDPAMVALLAEVDAGHPVRVPLVEGQSARGLRTAISRAATSRGLSVET